MLAGMIFMKRGDMMELIHTIEKLFDKFPMSPASFSRFVLLALICCTCKIMYSIGKLMYKRNHSQREAVATGGLELKKELTRTIRAAGSRTGGPQIFQDEVATLSLAVEKAIYQPPSQWLSKKTRSQLKSLRNYLDNLRKDLNGLPRTLERLLHGREDMFRAPLSDPACEYKAQALIPFISEEWNSVLEAYGFENKDSLCEKASNAGLYEGKRKDFDLNPFGKLRRNYIYLCTLHYEKLIEYRNTLWR